MSRYQIPTWSGREIKSVARELVFSGGPKRGIVTLPGSECLDVSLAKKRGMINSETRLHLIERSRPKQNEIREWIRRQNLPCQCSLHGMEMSECQIDDNDIDLAFIDLLGNPTYSDLGWLRTHLSPKMSIGSDFAITCSLNPRNNPLPIAVENILWDEDRERFMEIASMMADYPRDFHPRFVTLYRLLVNYVFGDRAVESIHFGWYRDTTWWMFLVKMKIGGVEFDEESNHIRSLIDRQDCSIYRGKHRGPSTSPRFYEFLPQPEVVSERDVSPPGVKNHPSYSGRVKNAAEILSSDVTTAYLEEQDGFERLLDDYVNQERRKGKNAIQVRAGIKAAATRARLGAHAS